MSGSEWAPDFEDETSLEELVKGSRLAKRQRLGELLVSQGGLKLDEFLADDRDTTTQYVARKTALRDGRLNDLVRVLIANQQCLFECLRLPSFDPDEWPSLLAKSQPTRPEDTNSIEYYLRVFTFENEQSLKDALRQYLLQYPSDYSWVVICSATLGTGRSEVIQLLTEALDIDTDFVELYLTSARYQSLKLKLWTSDQLPSEPRNMIYAGMTVVSTGRDRHSQDSRSDRQRNRLMRWNNLPQVPNPKIYRFIGLTGLGSVKSNSVRKEPILGEIESRIIRAIPAGQRINSAPGGWRINWPLPNRALNLRQAVFESCVGLQLADDLQTKPTALKGLTMNLEVSVRQATKHFLERGELHPSLTCTRGILDERTNFGTYRGVIIRAQIMRERPNEAHLGQAGPSYSAGTGRSFASWRSLMSLFHPELQDFEDGEAIEDIPRSIFARLFGVVLDIWALVPFETQTRVCLLVLWRDIMIMRPLFVSHWGTIPAALFARHEVFLAFAQASQQIDNPAWLDQFIKSRVTLSDADRDLGMLPIPEAPMTHADMMEAIGSVMIIPYGKDQAYIGTFTQDLGASKYIPDLAKERRLMEFLSELQNQVIVRVLKDLLHRFDPMTDAYPGIESLKICRERVIHIGRTSGLTAELHDAKALYSARSQLHHGLAMMSRYRHLRKNYPIDAIEFTSDHKSCSSEDEGIRTRSGKSARLFKRKQGVKGGHVDQAMAKMTEEKLNVSSFRMLGRPNSVERRQQLDILNNYYTDRRARGMMPLDRYKLSTADLPLNGISGGLEDSLYRWLAQLSSGIQPYEAVNGHGRTAIGQQIAKLCRARGTAQLNTPASLLVRYPDAYAVERKDTILCIQSLGELADPARLRTLVTKLDITLSWRAVRCHQCGLTIIRHVNPRHSHFCSSSGKWIMLSPSNFPSMVRLDLVHDLRAWLGLQDDLELLAEFDRAAAVLTARSVEQVISENRKAGDNIPSFEHIPLDLVYAKPESSSDVWMTFAIHLALSRWPGSATNASLEPGTASALQAQSCYIKAIIDHFKILDGNLPTRRMGRRDPKKVGRRKGNDAILAK